MTIKEFNHITEFLDYLYKLTYPNTVDNSKIDDFFKNLQLMVRINKGNTFSDNKYLSGYSSTPIAFMGYLDSSYLKALNEIHELELGKLLNETEKKKIKQLFLLVGFQETDAEKILKDLCNKLPCDVDILIKFPTGSNVDITEEYIRNDENIENIKEKINGELNMNEKPESFELQIVNLDNGIVPTKDNLLKIFQALYPTEYELLSKKFKNLENLEQFFKVGSETLKGIDELNLYNPIEDYLSLPNYTNRMINWECHYGNVTSVILCHGKEDLDLTTNNNLYIIRIKIPESYVNYCEDNPGDETHEEKRRKLVIEYFKNYTTLSNPKNYIDIIKVEKADYPFVIRRLLHIRNNFNSLFQGDGQTYSDTMTTVKDRKYEIVTKNVDITKANSGNWAVIKLFQKQVYTGRYGKRNSVDDVKQFMLNFLNSLANTNISQNTRRMSDIKPGDIKPEDLEKILEEFETRQSGDTAGDATGGGKVNNSYKLKTKKLNKKNRNTNTRLMTKKN